jgi:hypothetical protein
MQDLNPQELLRHADRDYGHQPTMSLQILLPKPQDNLVEFHLEATQEPFEHAHCL